MNSLYLLRYNNYFNRIVKQEANLSGYMPYVLSDVPSSNPLLNINFNPNDGIQTEQIINWRGEEPDYIVVADEDSNIVSRWFVLRHERTRAQQYRLVLRRDLIVDFYSAIISAPCFIEKATLNSTNNLIFNAESMTFNQIKTREVLLKDEFGCPWIVLYGSRATYDDSGNETPTTFTGDIIINYPATTITQQELNDLQANERKRIAGSSSVMIQLIARSYAEPPLVSARGTEYTMLKGQPIMERTNIGSGLFPTNNTFVENAKNILESNTLVIDAVNNLASGYFPAYNPTLFADVQSKINKVFKVGTAYYRIKLYHTGNTKHEVPRTTSGALITALNPLISAFQTSSVTVGGVFTSDANIHVTYSGDYISYTIEQVRNPSSTSEILFDIDAARYHATDVPYDIFCMPLSDSLVIMNSQMSGFTEARSDIMVNLQIASNLLSKYSKVGQIFDAQILPYCPITTAKLNNGKLDLADNSLYSYSKFHEVDGAFIGYILHASTASFTKVIELDMPITVKDYKVESQTDVYRFCSPNYASVFEINAAMNGGISTINVSCTYKPFDPYIKVYPDFKRLYGNSFNDARGLICGGDYSLATLTDAWETYQLQNKNFQEIFDRQIQNIEIHNKYSKISDIANATTGAASNIVTGFMAGSPIGALIGGVASAAGGAYDTYVNEKLRKEDLNYLKDRFGYELGNIKALPQTLTRTSAYNVDNKYFPFIEYYTCSDEEKLAFKNKLKYNGMTVMAIGTIGEYLRDEPSFVKGQIIRLEGIDESYAVCSEIFDELNKGVYI